MEIPAMILGFTLLVVAMYAGLISWGAQRRRRMRELEQSTAIERQADVRSVAFSTRTGASTDQPVLGGLFSEVDMLRAQVESLRSEMSAMSGLRNEKARLRRHRVGIYTDLPRRLRRQVREAREVRNFRHPISV